MSKTPKKIHLFWSAPEGVLQMPSDVDETISAWRCTHPDYEIRIWSLSQVLELADNLGMSDVEAAIQSCRLIAMKSDVARALIMFAEGGTYTDLKNVPTRQFLNRLVASGNAVVTRYPPELVDVETGAAYFNGIMVGPAGNELFARLLRKISWNIINRVEGGLFWVSGSGVLTAAVGECHDVVIDDGTLWKSVDSELPALRRVAASYNGPSQENHWRNLQGEGIYTDK